jgi:hypothetical protein
MYFNYNNPELSKLTSTTYTRKIIIIRNTINNQSETFYKSDSFHKRNILRKNHNLKTKKLFFSNNCLEVNSVNTISLKTNNQFEQENFWNLSFDKGRIKTLVSWFLKTYGQKKTIQLVENLKNIGFEYATKAGISLGIEDLKISPTKAVLIAEAEKQTHEVITQYKRAQITGVERFQRLIDTWHRTSENLKQEVINYFEMTDLLNPVYMMAFSGARGNISQVRQLVGMRGLMADPKGQILDFPIRSNFREGLTLTEYLISSYGARKGIVDTALRTANAGYLTRRLVDVAQHVIVSHYDCGTTKGILISDMKEGTKIIYSLQNRLIGRVLAQDIYSATLKIASRNQEISSELAIKIAKVSSKVLIRSALTCETRKLICQLCYGWSLGQGKLVSIGDAVGVIAAQSIGEPGTQLTMRTFHTGGVFSSDVNDQILGPYDGIIQYSSFIPGTLVRTPQGKIAFLSKAEGSFVIKTLKQNTFENENEQKTKFFKIPPYTLLFCRHNERVDFKQVVAQICSSSTQNKQRDDAEQSIKTELQGQVYMDHLTLIEQTNDYGDTNQQSWDWGYIWILSGKIYEIPVDSYIFPKFGDFVTKNSILNEIQWMTPDKSELQITLKNSFSEIFNKKLPNKKDHKLLNNFQIKKNSRFLNKVSFFSLNSDKETEKLYNHNSKKQDYQISYTAKEKLETTFVLKTHLQNSISEKSIKKDNFDYNHQEINNKVLKFNDIEANKFRNPKIQNFRARTLFKSSWLTKKSFSAATDLQFKKPLLLFDTNKFSYKKIGYFFKLNLPLSKHSNYDLRSINKIECKQTYYKSLLISPNDKFFIPVNLESSSKLFTTNIYSTSKSKTFLTGEKRLENSFDWKIFPNILLTWFPSIYDSKNSSFISYEIPEFTSVNLEESEYFILKQKNSSFYSKLKKNIVQFPLKNLSYNQTIYNKFNSTYSYLPNLTRHKTENSKKLWFFSEKQENQFLKMNLISFHFDSNQMSDSSNFKRYSELRWKNSKMFSNKEFFYRGRIFTIPHELHQFIGLEIQRTLLSPGTEKQFTSNSFNWQTKNSYLYSNFTRQGKNVSIFSNFDGFIQVYNNSVFSKPNKYNLQTKTTNNVVSSINGFSSSQLEKAKHQSSLDLNAELIRHAKAETMSEIKDEFVVMRQKDKFSDLSTKEIFQSLKRYNKQYYIALKFKVLKMNLNNTHLKKLIFSMNNKNYKKLLFLKSSYLNKNMAQYNYEVKKNEIFIDNRLPVVNFVKLQKSKNSTSIGSMFKFSFLNLKSYLEKRFIFNKIKSQVSNFGLQIQSGWIYIPKTVTSHLFKYDKSIIPVGKVFIDDLLFGSELVYLETIVMKSVFFKYNLNFLNLFSSIDFSTTSFSKTASIYKSIQKRHNTRSNVNKYTSNSLSETRLTNKDKSLNQFSDKLSCHKLKWIFNEKLRNNSLIDCQFKQSNFDTQLNFSSFKESTRFNISKLILNSDLNSQFVKQSDYNFLLVIKKVNEYNIQEMSYYKNNLYTAQITNFSTNFSFLLKQQYHTGNLNKQFKNARLISKFPNVDFRIESVVKLSSVLKDYGQGSLIPSKKLLKTNYFYSLPTVNFKKILFYSKSSSLLYFKLHLINNSTFQMNSKKPDFNFNYLNGPNFSTMFFTYFNLMYTQILNYSINNLSNSSFYSLALPASKLFPVSEKLDLELFNITLLFSTNLSKLFFTPFFNFSVSQTPAYFLNNRFFVKAHLNKLFATAHIENVGLSTTSQKFSNTMLIPFPKVKNAYICKLATTFLSTQPFAYSSFLSPYEGELLLKTKQNWNTTFQKNRLIILTKNDLVSFTLKIQDVSSIDSVTNIDSVNSSFSLLKNTLFNSNDNISIQRDLFMHFSKKLYKIDNLQVMEPKCKNVFLIGQFIYYGDQINTTLAIPQAGQVVHLSTKKLTIRKGQSIFVSSKAILHAYNGDLIDKNFPVVTLPYQKLKAGDIVQGIPKIEQFFEARITRRGRLFRDSIPNLLKGLFKRYKLKYPLLKAVRQSFYKIQQILVDGVQRVYRSQGVTIADKHIEIIVKQMTCKVKIINGGQTGFFPGELVDLEFVEQINKVLMNKVYYEPVVLGITKASLEVESFLSAASFQQTTRMLSKAALSRKKDFLKGLKENVIVGNLIPSGTGYLIYLQDSYKNFKI